jgi:AmmeMemoRadiSam system protein A
MHRYPDIAKRAVEEFVRTGNVLPTPEDLPEEMKARAGVFVCLKEFGRLRGCIGTFMPCTENVHQEIVRNAISAAREDPRFPPVSAEELPDITYSVDILSEPEKMEKATDLDPRKYGVIVAKGQRRGLLLPDLEGVDSVDDQLRIAKSKAGIDPSDNDVLIFRFTVRRYT